MAFYRLIRQGDTTVLWSPRELLRREHRAARQSDEPGTSRDGLPLMPDREEEFLRLALMSIDDLETHVERLERDLDDLETGFDDPECAETE
jgi:hypothetical protein